MKKSIDRLIKTIFRLVLRGLFALLYRVRVNGIEHYRAAGERVLMVANHQSFLDPMLLWTYLPGDPAFVINPHIARRWWVRPALLFIPVLPMEPGKPLAIRHLIARLKQGKSAIVFPEGRITVTGGLMKIYPGPALVADRVGATLLPVRLDGPQYTPFSRLRCRVRLRWFPPITLTLLPPRRIDVSEDIEGAERHKRVGAMLSDLMVEMMFLGSDTRRTLYRALLDARAIQGWGYVVAEDVRREPMTYRQVILRAHVLGRLMVREIEGDGYVGLLLPTTTTTALAFFGLHLHGRVPAMINFSMGVGGMISTVATARIGTVFTSRRFVTEAKLTEDVAELAGQSVRIRYLEDLAETVGLGLKLRGAIAAHFPYFNYRRLSGDPSPDEPAVVLFTSGSEGAPKGVVLSHANLMANVEQIKSRGDFRATDTVLNALPMFHSFGLTIGTLLPMLSGMKVFFYPSPLDYRVIPEIAYEARATIMFGTNTFLAGYARYAHPYDFHGLRYIFAGGEKLQNDTRQTWMERFGVRLFEGYGATETAPVLCFNTPMENRAGSVGRLVPGVEYRLEPVDGVAEGGRLWVRGPNVMLGYLLADRPGELRPLETGFGPGWYDTGDIVGIDEDGYLWVRGRVRRFAKIGAEMVSLTAIEEFAHRAWANFSHAVVTVPHPHRGEQLVLVTECPTLDRLELLARAREEGIGEIGIPKRIVPVEAIPLLGTGKTDYAGVAELAGKEV